MASAITFRQQMRYSTDPDYLQRMALHYERAAMYGIVITDPEDKGIYLGESLGMGFWTQLDPCAQNAAVAFPSLEAAARYVAGWEQGGDPLLYTYVVVRPDLTRGAYASIAALKAAGLGHLLGDMEKEYLAFRAKHPEAYKGRA